MDRSTAKLKTFDEHQQVWVLSAVSIRGSFSISQEMILFRRQSFEGRFDEPMEMEDDRTVVVDDIRLANFVAVAKSTSTDWLIVVENDWKFVARLILPTNYEQFQYTCIKVRKGSCWRWSISSSLRRSSRRLMLGFTKSNCVTKKTN